MNQPLFLFLNALVIATCGLVYELLAGAAASYLLGDSIFQYSTIIGLYLFAMGVGSWLSGFLEKNLARIFVEIEFAVALLGGSSAAIYFLAHAYVPAFRLILYGVVFVIGTLVGLEIPLLMRILKEKVEFKELVARVLAFDYIGALVASLAFPILLLPMLGMVRTPMAVGILNAAVGIWATWLLRDQMPSSTAVLLRIRGFMVIGILIGGLFAANFLVTLAEEGLYQDRVVFTRTTPYQRIVITRATGGGFRLYLNGHLQFNSLDEYRYHEALVHPAMMAVKEVSKRPVKKVLVLGGGDGLALREVFRYPEVEEVTLVDLDPGMTTLADRFPPLGALNNWAYSERKDRDGPSVRKDGKKRLTVINQDAYIWIQQVPKSEKFDVVIIDFPDPHNFSLGKLYTTRFYRLLRDRLEPHGAAAVQSTSPFTAPKTFWCIVKTMRAAGFHVDPYHCAVPSFFGVWGFSLARPRHGSLSEEAPPLPTSIPRELVEPDGTPARLRFLTDAMMRNLFVFPQDLAEMDVEVNRLDNQVVVQYHGGEWGRFVR